MCSCTSAGMMLHSGVQGMRSLVSSGEVHDALSYENLDLKRMERLADWGGLTFFQLTGQLQKGVDRLHAQAVVRCVLLWDTSKAEGSCKRLCGR